MSQPDPTPKPGAILLEYVVTMSGVVGQGTAPDQGEPA